MRQITFSEFPLEIVCLENLKTRINVKFACLRPILFNKTHKNVSNAWNMQIAKGGIRFQFMRVFGEPIYSLNMCTIVKIQKLVLENSIRQMSTPWTVERDIEGFYVKNVMKISKDKVSSGVVSVLTELWTFSK